MLFSKQVYLLYCTSSPTYGMKANFERPLQTTFHEKGLAYARSEYTFYVNGQFDVVRGRFLSCLYPEGRQEVVQSGATAGTVFIFFSKITNE